tara:strand:+ start:2354 stop:2848 length:495 start_codon:yes stop_codon:yes gene_type:complete
MSVTGKARGFSILEILITLAVVVLFSGFFVLYFDDSQDEELLTRCSSEVKGLALKAKKRSFAYRREHYLILSRSSILLSDSFDPESSEGSAGLVEKAFQVPAEVRMEILPPGKSKWVLVTEYLWTFRDSGLSDPVQLRFSVGGSYTELKFNVLTGQADEVTFIN